MVLGLAGLQPIEAGGAAGLQPIGAGGASRTMASMGRWDRGAMASGATAGRCRRGHGSGASGAAASRGRLGRSWQGQVGPWPSAVWGEPAVYPCCKKKVRLMVRCALYDLQSCKICRLSGGAPYSLVRLVVMKLL